MLRGLVAGGTVELTAAVDTLRTADDLVVGDASRIAQSIAVSSSGAVELIGRAP